MATVTVRYWAAAKEAADMGEETVSARTLGDALDAVRGRRAGDGRFHAVLARSSFLVDGVSPGRREAGTVLLAQGATVEILPAFAGG